jgi:hypothetical protein
VFIVDHHEGYISWEQYERNQRVMADNANSKGLTAVRGSIRRGSTLLNGFSAAVTVAANWASATEKAAADIIATARHICMEATCARSFSPPQASMPPCSGPSRPSPAGGRKDAASLDCPCGAAAAGMGDRDEGMLAARIEQKNWTPVNRASTDQHFQTGGFRAFLDRC